MRARRAELFRYSSFVLSLLLAFRANRTYDRWWQARCAWGGIGGGIVNVVRQVATWHDDPVYIRCVLLVLTPAGFTNVGRW